MIYSYSHPWSFSLKLPRSFISEPSHEAEFLRIAAHLTGRFAIQWCLAGAGSTAFSSESFGIGQDDRFWTTQGAIFLMGKMGKDWESGVGLVGLVVGGWVGWVGWVGEDRWDACWLILYLAWLVGIILQVAQFARQWRSICDHINWRASVGWHVFARMVWVRCWRTTWAWERHCNASVCWSIWRSGFSLRHFCGEWWGSAKKGDGLK